MQNSNDPYAETLMKLMIKDENLPISEDEGVKKVQQTIIEKELNNIYLCCV